MRALSIEINGTSYPCQLTMGAMVRFEEEVGHGIKDFNGTVRDTCAFVWACVYGGAKRHGMHFDMAFMDFCDALDPEAVNKLWESLQAEQSKDAAQAGASGDIEKKMP